MISDAILQQAAEELAIAINESLPDPKEFVIENFPAASTNPNGPYVIEHDELVGTEAQTNLTYRFEIKDRETLIFHKDNEYGLLEDGSVFKLKME